jgi:tetratricopeptide (TPR) repeat protein
MRLETMAMRFAQLGFVVAVTLVTASLNSQGQSAADVDHQRQIAISQEQQGSNEDAEAAWRAVLKLQPANPEAYAHLGLLEARQEHYAEAISLYRKAWALNPAMPGLRLNLGLSLFKSGALKEAIDTFTPLLKSQPPSSAERLRLTTLIGLAYYGLGEYATAVPYLKEATSEDPRNLPFRLVLAHSCLWSKQYQCVLDVYHQILTLNAESGEADMLAGEALDEMKDDDGALEQFRAAAKADPRMPEVHFGLGYLLWRLLQYEEAAREFNAELANNPDHAQAVVYLADTEMRLNRAEAAPALLEKAIRLDPKIELAHLDLGILDGDQGRKDDALRELKIAEQLSPGDQNVHWRLARTYQAAGMKDEAKAEFDKTRGLHHAADETVFKKLHEAQAKGKPDDAAHGGQIVN